MTDSDKDRNSTQQDDGGIVDGEPGAGTDANYSAPPPKMKEGVVDDVPPGLEQTGGDGTAPTVVK